MLSNRQTRRAQRSLLFVGIALAFCYTFILSPLARRAESRNAPLAAAWKKLAAVGIRSNEDHELNLGEIAAKLKEAKVAVATLESASKRIEASVALDPALRQKMTEPFQLVDFQIEELLRIEELGRTAQQNQVQIPGAVFSKFPEYRGDREDPGLLWAQLSFLNELMVLAIKNKVAAIENIDTPAYAVHRAITDGVTNTEAFLYEIPIEVELVGSMESISRLLASLPLRAEELKAANLPESSENKPLLFIQRILLTKSSPLNPDEAGLKLRASGFIYRDW